MYAMYMYIYLYYFNKHINSLRHDFLDFTSEPKTCKNYKTPRLQHLAVSSITGSYPCELHQNFVGTTPNPCKAAAAARFQRPDFGPT